VRPQTTPIVCKMQMETINLIVQVLFFLYKNLISSFIRNLVAFCCVYLAAGEVFGIFMLT
jgi:hypothetical protein